MKATEAVVHALMNRGFQTERLDGAKGLHDALEEVIRRELTETTTYTFTSSSTPKCEKTYQDLLWENARRYCEVIVPTPKSVKGNDDWEDDLQNQL